MDAASDWVAENRNGQWGVLEFDGSNDYVDVGDHPTFNFGDKEYFCSVIFRPDTISSSVRMIVVGKDVSGGRHYALEINGDGNTSTNGSLQWTHWNASGPLPRRFRTAANTLVQGEWCHATFYRSGSSIKLWLNGQDVSLTQVDGTLSTLNGAGSSSLNIGRRSFSGFNDNFHGAIASVRLGIGQPETYNQSRRYFSGLLNRESRFRKYFVPSGGGGVTATASGSGSGTGTATATVDIQASASGSGSGTGAATATIIIVAVAAGSGSGDGAAVVTPTVTGSAAGSGLGDGAATAVVTINATASGSGSGDGDATATVQITGVASGSSGGTGAATATITISATAAGSGSGTGVVIVAGVPVVYDVTISVATVGVVTMATPVAIGAVALTTAAVGAVAITLGADMYHVGDTLKITGTFTVDGTETDPTSVSLQVRDPSGNIATYTYADAEVSKVSTGVYSYNLLLDEDGVWFVKWIGEGAVVTATEDTKLKVERTRFVYPPA